MKLLRDARNLSASSLLAMGLLSVRAILVLGIVGPTVIGVWKSALVLTIIAGFFNLGLPLGILLRVPHLAGEGREEEARRNAEAATSFTVLVGLVLGAVIFGFSFLVQGTDYRLAMRLVALLVLVRQPYEAMRELAGARHMFSVRARETLIDAVTSFVTTLVLASLFGLAGLGVSAILTVVVPFAYLMWKLRARFPFRLDLPRLRQLVRAGLPFSMHQMLVTFVRHGTLGLIALLLGPTPAGYFALSMMFVEFTANIVDTGLTRVVSPHMQREVGRSGSLSNVVGYYEMPMRLFAYTLPPALALLSLLIPSAVRLALPQYVPGVEAAQVMIWSIFFLAIHSVVSPFLGAAGRFGTSLKLFAIALPAGFAVQFALISSGFGLVGAAWGSVATMAMVTTVELLVARRAAGVEWRHSIGVIGQLYLPLAASILFCEVVRAAPLAGALTSWWQVSFKAALFLLLYAPLLWAYEHRFSLLRTLREGMKSA